MRRFLGHCWEYVSSAGRWATVLDIAVKLGTVIALLAAGRQFLLRADVKLVANSARFVDAATVKAEYEVYDLAVPHLVIDVANLYDRRNLVDLRTADNSTQAELSTTEVCAADVEFVKAVFGADACNPGKAEPLGRGAYYERKLVYDDIRAGKPLTVEQVKLAYEIMRRSEFRRYRVCVRNIGRHRATSVRIFPSAGYQAAPGYDPGEFALRPGEEAVRDFVTAVGYQEGQPRATTDLRSTDGAGTPGSPEVEARRSELPDSVPKGSCLRKTGATEATLFSADWSDNPGRPGNATVGAGFVFVAGLLALLFLRSSTGTK